MADDAALVACLVCLAAVIVTVGIATQSLEKMALTYVVGIIGIAGVMLPDWCFFNRDFSRWTSPITAEERALDQSFAATGFRRFRIYPIRLVVYTTVYSIVLYQWWKFISS